MTKPRAMRPPPRNPGLSAKVAAIPAAGILVAMMILAIVPLALWDRPFAAHMARHMILMDVIAPLVVIAAYQSSVLQRFRQIAHVPMAAAVHAVVMWGWHVPVVLEAVHRVPLLHVAMPASFFLAGVMFWWSIAATGTYRQGAAIFWLFMSVMHTGFLGAVLTFARRPLYDASPDDQHLGGLIMWVLGSAVYGIAGLLVAGRWLRDLEHQTQAERAA